MAPLGILPEESKASMYFWRYALEIMVQWISMSTSNLMTTSIHLTFHFHLFRVGAGILRNADCRMRKVVER